MADGSASRWLQHGNKIAAVKRRRSRTCQVLRRTLRDTSEYLSESGYYQAE